MRPSPTPTGPGLRLRTRGEVVEIKLRLPPGKTIDCATRETLA
jgi:hypothetical protein